MHMVNREAKLLLPVMLGVGFLGFSGIGLVSAYAATGSSGVFWRSDFEDGTLGITDIWFTRQVGHYPDCLRVVKTGPVAHGAYALDVRVHPDDTPSSGDKDGFKSRDELSQGGSIDRAAGAVRTHSRPGDTAFYRVAYYFPADMNPNEHGYNIITQFHGFGAGTRPVVEIAINAKIKPYKLEAQAHGGKNKKPESKSWDLGALPNSPNWVEVIMGVHWVADTTGWVEIWRRDGLAGSWQNTVPRVNTCTLYSDTTPPGAYLKLGYYRGPDGKIGKARNPWPQISHLIIDNIMAGDSLESVRKEEPK